MSYERAVQAMRARPVEPPPLSRIEAALRVGADPSAPGDRVVARARWALRVAMLGFVAMALLERLGPDHMGHHGRAVAAMLPLAMLIAADRMVAGRHLGHQMLVRAIAWSNLVVGVLVAVWGLPAFAPAGAAIAVGSGTALLVLGGRGLGVASGVFRPIAFRNQLLVALVMAFADAETLLFSGIVELGIGRMMWHADDALRMAGPTLACGALMVVAVWGLYRMRVWALLLNIAANVGIAWAALGGHLGLTLPVAGALAATAGIQLLLPVPILAAALGDRNPDRPPLRRFGPWVARWTIVAFMTAGALGWTMPSSWPSNAGYVYWRTGWVERTHRTSHRGVGHVEKDDANLAGEDLSHRALYGASFRRADLSDADLDYAGLVDGRLDEATLDRASMRNVGLSRATLTGASLRDVELRFSDLDGADFSGADLRKADLRGSFALEAVFDDANLDGANLGGAIVDLYPTLWRVEGERGSATQRAPSLRGATCPDFTPAGDGPHACRGHLGRLEDVGLVPHDFTDGWQLQDPGTGGECATWQHAPSMAVTRGFLSVGPFGFVARSHTSLQSLPLAGGVELVLETRALPDGHWHETVRIEARRAGCEPQVLVPGERLRAEQAARRAEWSAWVAGQLRR